MIPESDLVEPQPTIVTMKRSGRMEQQMRSGGGRIPGIFGVETRGAASLIDHDLVPTYCSTFRIRQRSPALSLERVIVGHGDVS